MNKKFITAIAAGMLLVTSATTIAGCSVIKPELNSLFPISFHAPLKPHSVLAEPVHPFSNEAETASLAHPVSKDLAASPLQLAISDDMAERPVEHQATVLNYSYNGYSGDWFAEDGSILILPVDYANAMLMITIVEGPYKKTGYRMVAEFDESTKTFYYTHVTKKEVWFSKDGKVSSETETQLSIEGELYFWKDYGIWNDKSEGIRDHLFRFARKPSAAPVEDIDINKIKAERARLIAELEEQ